MILKLPRDFEFMINRRAFLRKVGTITGTSITGAVVTPVVFSKLEANGRSEAAKIYGDNLSPLPKSDSKVHVIVYSKGNEVNELREKSIQAGAITGAGLGVAAETASTMSKEKKKTTRRGLLKAVGVGIGLAVTGSLATPIRQREISEGDYADLSQLNELTHELRDAGHKITIVNTLADLSAALIAAKLNRSKNAKTLVLLNAHGNKLNDKSHVVIEDTNVPFDSIVKAVGNIPGHTLIAANACNLDTSEVQNRSKTDGKISLISGSGAFGEFENTRGVPFFSALRRALRTNDVVEGTRTIYPELLKRAPEHVRQTIRKLGSTPMYHSEGQFTL